MLKRIKNEFRRRKLAQEGYAVEHACTKAAYGDAGGRWVICPQPISAKSIVYSVGIGRDLSFDLALIERHQTVVHAFDPTPACVEWVRQLQLQLQLPPQLVFHEIGLAAFDGHLDFHAPRKATSSHFSPVSRYKDAPRETIKAPVKRLSTIMNTLGHSRIDLLKIDIEGGEYDVLTDVIGQRIPIHQILIEFHHCYETIPLRKTLDALSALRAAGYRIFDISERTYEIGLINEAYSTN